MVRVVSSSSSVRIVGLGTTVLNEGVRPLDPSRRAREALRRELAALGCKEFDGSMEGDWWWTCRVCGYEVYVEVPREWPLPKGVGKPTPLHLWVDEGRIPSQFYNMYPTSKNIKGKTLRLVCIYNDPSGEEKIDPMMNPTNLLELFRLRLLELGVKCPE